MDLLKSDLNNKLIFFNSLSNCYKKLLIGAYINIRGYRKNIPNICLERYFTFLFITGIFPKITKIFFKKNRIWKVRKKNRNKSIGIYIYISISKYNSILHINNFSLPIFRYNIKKLTRSLVGSLALANKRKVTLNLFGLDYLIKLINLENINQNYSGQFLLKPSESVKLHHILKYNDFINSYFGLLA